MEERAQAARQRHHAIALRSLIKASGMEAGDWLAQLAVTEPVAAAQGAALLAYDDHLRAKAQARQAARDEADSEGWHRRALAAEDEAKGLRDRVGELERALDRTFRVQHSRGASNPGAGRPKG